MNNIKSSIFTVGFFLLWSFAHQCAIAAPPSWSVNPASYGNSMVMVGALNFARVESIDENDMIAAFINGECRGVGKPMYEADVDRFLAYLMIYANESEAQISFKLYDADIDKIYDVPKTLSFEVNGLKGELERPYVWSSVQLEESAVLLSYSVPGQISSNISEQNVQVKVRKEKAVDAMTPTFILSDGATLFLDGKKQISGEETVDLTNPVIYTVRSEDEQTFVDYTVEVIPTEVREGEPPNAVNAFTPNNDGNNDFWVVRNSELFESFDLHIYDRSGNEVFKTNHYQNNWDGTYKGNPLPEGIYYYLFLNGETSFKGIVTILQ